MEQGVIGTDMPIWQQHVGEIRWKKVDIRTIITEPRLGRKEGERRGAEIQKFQINETSQITERAKDQIVQNDIEYADDTHNY